MLTDKLIVDLIKGVKVDAVIAAVAVIVAYYVGSLIKGWIEDRLEMRRFRHSRYIALGTRVVVNGFEGKVKSIANNEIKIRGEKGCMVIPVSRWRQQTWIFPE